MNDSGLLAVGAGLSQVVLAAALLFGGRFEGLSRTLYALLLSGVAAYLLMPMLGHGSAGWLLMALATAVPGTFWLFCASLFDDHYEFPWWHPALVAVSVLFPVLFLALGWPEGGPGDWLLRGVPQVLEFVFMALALLAIFRNWRDDLVMERRQLRFWFCAGVGAFMFVLILSREVLFAGAAWLRDVQYLATAVTLLGTNILLLRYPQGTFDPIQRADPPTTEPEVRPTIPEAPDTAVQFAPVRRLIEEEGIHREHGMTIGKLAVTADIPEYRLRQLINGGLGYRNFNDFLNHFRIEEASKRLADPGEARIPVLTIALDVGFRSISSFNKCFKDTHGMTPTAYRRSRLEASQTA